MVQKPVTHTCLMYVAGLGVRNFERMVSAMHIGLISQGCMQFKKILFQRRIEINDVRFFTFADFKFFPRRKKIGKRDYLLK